MHEELTRKELSILRSLVHLYREDYKLASTPGLEEHLYEVDTLREKLAYKWERTGTHPSA